MIVVIWALLTGAITGGVFTAILMKTRQRRLVDDYEALLDDNAAHVAELERVTGKMLELEERVESAESLLIQQQQRDALPPPS
jgi:hypothetical protein